MTTDFTPAFAKNNIPVFFAADDNYAPYLGVAIKSLISVSSQHNNYDICILYEYISNEKQELIRQMQTTNISIRFFNITPLLKKEKKKITYTCQHFTVAMYYRIFISDIFKCYDKAIYLDCDTIILKDIADFYKTDLKNYVLGAISDFGAIQKNNLFISQSYIRNKLKIIPEKYINSGVLLINCNKFRKQKIKQICLEKLEEIKTPLAPDQDIINAACYKKIKYLPLAWNFEWQLPNCNPNYVETIPENMQKEFLTAQKTPYIIHYTGEKPWRFPQQNKADKFWEYARQTPFYETIIYTNLNVINNIPFKDAILYQQNWLSYWKYKILSKITLGNLRKKLNHRKKEMKNKLKSIKKLT